MFEWGFWEFVLIAVVALVVIGPERLPRVARVAGLWIGRARRSLSTVRDEINRELKADELKSIMEKQARSRPLETIIEGSRQWLDQPVAAPLEQIPAGAAKPETPASEAPRAPAPEPPRSAPETVGTSATRVPARGPEGTPD